MKSFLSATMILYFILSIKASITKSSTSISTITSSSSSSGSSYSNYGNYRMPSNLHRY